MGCFLACFGFQGKKKKRRKPGNRSPSGEQDNVSYVPLDSDVSIKLDIKELITSDSKKLNLKPDEQAIQKLKKKVTFNLNVKAYEPIPDYNDDDMGACLSDGEEETEWELNTETRSSPTLHFEEEDAIASRIWSYSATHRYQNCDDDEDSEFKIEDDELDFDEIEESDDYYNYNEIISGESENTSPDHFFESKSNVRDRRQYVSSVLNPIENLSQWKVVKSKAATAQFKYQKENSMTKRESPTVVVDASLSNWLETQTITKIGQSNRNAVRV